MCKPCPYNCRSCSSQSSCTVCLDGYYLSSTPKPGSQACQPCPLNCLRCQNVNNIEKCSVCSEGAYLDTATQTCKACPLGAKSCQDSTTISECLVGYQRSSNALFCTPCPENCLACPVSTEVCTTCNTSYYLSSSKCLKCTIANCQTCYSISSQQYCSVCAVGYYRQSTTSCLQCASNCQVCSSGTLCTQCKEGHYLASGNCVQANSLIQNCEIYLSTTVNGQHQCQKCSNGYYPN